MEAAFPENCKQINFIETGADGQRCPPHHHDELTETFVCLKGFMALTVDGVRHELRPTDEFTVRPGQTHRLETTPKTEYLELRDNIYQLENADKVMEAL